MPAHSTEPKRPQPLLSRAGVVTALTVLAAVLVRLNLDGLASWLTDLEDPIAGVILAAGPLSSAIAARRHVTPVDSPKDNAGNDLVPAGSTADTDAAAAAALAQADAIHPLDARGGLEPPPNPGLIRR